MSEMLKPCPRCGGEAEMFEYEEKLMGLSKDEFLSEDGIVFAVECLSCGNTTELCPFEEDAVDAWNRMANDD